MKGDLDNSNTARTKIWAILVKLAHRQLTSIVTSECLRTNLSLKEPLSSKW
jgi:hypothetical protein